MTAAEPLPAGIQAPDFASQDQDGRPTSLKSLRGKPVVLYFYPEDDTPGCTVEACGFRDNLGALQGHGAEILGVSTDDVESHRRFAEKFHLNFRLVADPKKEISRAYGVLGPDGYARRVTYLIDGHGIIRQVFPRVRPQEHPVEILKALAGLEGGEPRKVL